MVEVRRAKHKDTPWLFEQIAAFEKFAAYKRPLLVEGPRSQKILDDLIDNHVVLIAHDGNLMLGFVAGHSCPHPFNPDIHVLSEIFWWVKDEYRGTSAGARLLAAFEAEGKKKSDWIIFSLEHNSPVRDRHLIKRGFRQVERAYLLEV